MIVAQLEYDTVDVAGVRKRVPWWRASCTRCPGWIPQSRASMADLARGQGRPHDERAHGRGEQLELFR